MRLDTAVELHSRSTSWEAHVCWGDVRCWLLTRLLRCQRAASEHLYMPLQTWPSPRRRGLCGTPAAWTPCKAHGLLRHSRQLQTVRLRPCSAQVRACTCTQTIILPTRAEHTASQLPCIFDAKEGLTTCLLLHMVRQQSSQAAIRQSQRRTSLTRWALGCVLALLGWTTTRSVKSLFVWDRASPLCRK